MMKTPTRFVSRTEGDAKGGEEKVDAGWAPTKRPQTTPPASEPVQAPATSPKEGDTKAPVDDASSSAQE